MRGGKYCVAEDLCGWAGVLLVSLDGDSEFQNAAYHM